MKNIKSKSRKNCSQANKTQGQIIQFSKVSPIMLFRALVLLGTLIVATIAIQKEISDANVWSFLGSVVFYTALTTKADPKDNK